ncbi:disintegrin and metalloproteinase domain-containing protein 30 [Hyaena hyaena]|uniref:disintegrin and metalloproteinase domain-containing protein 30 n=1 Tax=Hyaena hyaena TaxID=95912 RepID=UPI001923789A|nr:disintegrin and metalloproteinase domain-containing protein 30 [Hyaena hyaena]
MRSGRTLLSPGRVFPVLFLAGLLADALGEDLIFHPEWGFESYEIIIPKQLSFREGQQGSVKQMSYLLQVKGKKYVLHLRPRRLLLPRNLKVLSFTEQGKLLEDHPYVPRDCYYIGLVEGTQDSEATFSTCTGGLRGILKIYDEHYQIEPLKASSSFEHVMYLLKKEDRFQNQSCGLTNDKLEKQMARGEDVARLRDLAESYSHQRYVETVMVFDHSRYIFLKSNATKIIHDAVLLAGILDAFFTEINVRVHLKGIEIWTSGDRINIRQMNTSKILEAFLKYLRTHLSPQIPADWTHLYVTTAFIHCLGWAYVGGACSQNFSGSVSSFTSLNILEASRWSAHELGHGIGMQHDTKDCCCKGKRTCIMGTGIDGFSNCSYINYHSYIHSNGDCLNDIPGLGYVISRCGNRIVEEGEECDCGSVEDCRSDRCCKSDCKLMPGTSCSTGLCCHNCQFRPLGHTCRKEENECDLPEYCVGNSAFCPEDTYKQDGTPCKHDSYCYRKGCHSRYRQCQSIFGPGAREAPSQCYEAVNIMGDQYGNCGIVGVHAYKTCTAQNAVCGRLQCINVHTIPDLPDHTTIISTYLRDENLICWGTGYHKSMIPMGIPDIGVVNDGTPCGVDRVCINGTCMPSSVLEFDCEPKKCNHRGICNNKKNCHCIYGWAPPYCEETGYGGSMNSGPARILTEEVPASVQIVSIMLIRLLFLALSVIIVLFRRLIGEQLIPKQGEIAPATARAQ